MKKLIVLVPVFLFVFGFTAGLILTTHDQAFALPECEYECLFEYDCSNETGPFCTSNPKAPYYRYRLSTCTGGPLNCLGSVSFVGCCSHFNPI